MRTRLWMMMGLLGWLTGTQAQTPVEKQPGIQMQGAQVPSSGLSGSILDSATGKPLEKAVLTFVDWGRKDSVRVMTDEHGVFQIHRTPTGDFLVVASFVGYQTRAIHFTTGIHGDLGRIVLAPGIREMQEVVIEAPAVTLREDTVEYRSDAYPVRKDAVLEDLLKKIPGLQIGKDGTILAYGKPVTKIRVNGKDFFLGDPRLATQNIPADVIDKIQVIDDKSDQAKLSGFDDGDRQQVINITIKKNRTDSYFGNVTVGGGTDDRYLASARAFRFDRDQQMAVIGNANNTNGNNVTSGATSSGPPDNEAQSLGFDFSGKLAPHLTLSGSYSYNGSRSTTYQQSERDYFLDTAYFYGQHTQTFNQQQSHNVQLTIGYGIGRQDSLILNPRLNYAINHQQTLDTFSFADANQVVTSSGTQAYASDNSSPNLSGSLSWLHRFGKTGRTLSATVSAGPGPAKETDNNFSTNHILTPNSIDTIWQVSDIHTQKQQYSAVVNYTEPLAKDKNLEVTYAFNQNGNVADKDVYDVSAINKTLNDSLTNTFVTSMVTNRLAVNFRQTEKKFNYQLGLGLQPTDLHSRSVIMDTPQVFDETSWQVVPIASFYYQFTSSKRLHFYYTGATQQPSINQLQPVPDYTNPLYVAEGNPKLKPAFNHSFRANYNDINKVTGRSFFLNAYVVLKDNAIVNNITLLAGGKQIVEPVNVKGNYTATGSYDYSIPFSQRTFVLSAFGNASYTNNVSLQSLAVNTGRNWSAGQTLRFGYNRGKWLELTTNIGYNLNYSSYSLEPSLKNQVASWDFSQDGRVDFRGDFSLRYSFDYKINEGLPPGIGSNVTLMSMVLEKRILREKGVVALSVNDLFNDNASFSHTDGQGYTEDDRNAVMGRFFLLSFTWKFQQFRGGRHP